jgi:hypothetical protein
MTTSCLCFSWPGTPHSELEDWLWLFFRRSEGWLFSMCHKRQCLTYTVSSSLNLTPSSHIFSLHMSRKMRQRLKI